MQNGFRDLFGSLQSYSISLLDGEQMVLITDDEMRPPPHDLRFHVDFKVDGITEEKHLGIQPAGKWRFVFTPRHIPQIVRAQEILGADFGPDAPDKWLIEPDNRNENASAQIEVFAVDHA